MRAEIGAQTNRQTSRIQRPADCSVNFAEVIFISEIGFFQLLSLLPLFCRCFSASWTRSSCSASAARVNETKRFHLSEMLEIAELGIKRRKIKGGAQILSVKRNREFRLGRERTKEDGEKERKKVSDRTEPIDRFFLPEKLRARFDYVLLLGFAYLLHNFSCSRLPIKQRAATRVRGILSSGCTLWNWLFRGWKWG